MLYTFTLQQSVPLVEIPTKRCRAPCENILLAKLPSGQVMALQPRAGTRLIVQIGLRTKNHSPRPLFIVVHQQGLISSLYYYYTYSSPKDQVRRATPVLLFSIVPILAFSPPVICMPNSSKIISHVLIPAFQWSASSSTACHFTEHHLQRQPEIVHSSHTGGAYIGAILQS